MENSSEEYDYSDYYNSTSLEIDEVCNYETVIKSGSTAIAIFFTVVVLLSLVGNVLVLVVLGLYKNFKSLSNLFLPNLAVSDLIFTLGLPFWACYYIWSWTFGEFMCKAVNFVFSVGFYSSTVFLMLMTIQRYVAVVYPQSVWNRWHRFVWPIVAWVFSFVAALPELLYSKVIADPTDPNQLYCVYDIFTGGIVAKYRHNVFFVVAFSVMDFCYIRILQSIIRSPTNNRHRNIRLISCVVLVFFVSWAPYNIMMFLQTLTFHQPFTHCDVSRRLDYVLYVCRLLAYSHCCVNPLLYVFVDVKFRTHLKRLLGKMFRC